MSPSRDTSSSTCRFPKSERLCSRPLIDHLYAHGHKLMAFPYSIHWIPVDSSGIPCKVLISTSKRKFHHAVDRNRVKRLTRECYRRHKHRLFAILNASGISILLSINYIHNEIMDSAQLDHKFDKLIPQLEKSIQEHLHS